MLTPSSQADIGIAVAGSCDAAEAAADIVLTEPGLSTIVLAVIASRKIFTWYAVGCACASDCASVRHHVSMLTVAPCAV